MNRYKIMIDEKTDLKLKPLAKEFPIRSHDNRNFIQSLLSKKYGIDYVGAACLSHREEKSNINARYTSMEYQDRLELYNEYWKILRENNFVQNAISEQISAMSKKSYQVTTI